MSKISTIIKNMRVPDLPYRLLSDDKIDQDQKQQVLEMLLDPAVVSSNKSALNALIEDIQPGSFVPKWYNCLFLADRFIDVYTRKNDFCPELLALINQWRFVFSYVFISLSEGEIQEADYHNLVKILDYVAKEHLGFSAALAKHEKVLEEIKLINLKLFVPKLSNADFQANLLKDVEVKLLLARERRVKLVSRLTEKEKGLSKARWSSNRAEQLLYQYFNDLRLPVSVIRFLTDVWLPYLKHSFLKAEANEVAERLISLSALLSEVFNQDASIRPDQIHDKGAELLESLEDLASSDSSFHHLSKGFMHDLQNELITIFQQKELESDLFQCKPPEDEHLRTSRADHLEGAWIEDVVSKARSEVSYYDEINDHYLMTNIYGAKTNLISGTHLKTVLENKSMKVLSPYTSLYDVVADSLKGLEKVVLAQLEQRRRAIEKARLEAQALREAKQKAEAEEKARKLKAAQEAKRLEAIIKAKELKAAEERRQLALLDATKQVEALRLGAWISVQQQNIKEKKKLAVKIKASQKLIFVDNLGLNKFEITVDQLSNALVDGDIVILDSGAEFDDSLQRTVSRIRMSVK